MIKYVSAIFLLYVRGISVNRNEVNKYEETYQKMLALFLAFLLAGFSGGFSPQQVFAQTTDKPKEPAVVKKTTTSITLKTENDLEYAIQTEKSDANGEAEQTSQETDGAKTTIWTWAKEEQYNRDSQTVIFQELKEGTTYNFTYRQKGSTSKEY